MTRGQTADPAENTTPTPVPAGVNEVRLRGLVREEPQKRDLESGHTVVTFRLGVPQDEGPGGAPRRSSSDWVDCAVWEPTVRRRAASWRLGDSVEVTGRLRRRFFRAAGATVARLEVEVQTGKVVRRARAGATQS